MKHLETVARSAFAGWLDSVCDVRHIIGRTLTDDDLRRIGSGWFLGFELDYPYEFEGRVYGLKMHSGEFTRHPQNGVELAYCLELTDAGVTTAYRVTYNPKSADKITIEEAAGEELTGDMFVVIRVPVQSWTPSKFVPFYQAIPKDAAIAKWCVDDNPHANYVSEGIEHAMMERLIDATLTK